MQQPVGNGFYCFCAFHVSSCANYCITLERPVAPFIQSKFSDIRGHHQWEGVVAVSFVQGKPFNPLQMQSCGNHWTLRFVLYYHICLWDRADNIFCPILVRMP